MTSFWYHFESLPYPFGMCSVLHCEFPSPSSYTSAIPQLIRTRMTSFWYRVESLSHPFGTCYVLHCLSDSSSQPPPLGISFYYQPQCNICSETALGDSRLRSYIAPTSLRPLILVPAAVQHMLPNRSGRVPAQIPHLSHLPEASHFSTSCNTTYAPKPLWAPPGPDPTSQPPPSGFSF